MILFSFLKKISLLGLFLMLSSSAMNKRSLESVYDESEVVMPVAQERALENLSETLVNRNPISTEQECRTLLSQLGADQKNLVSLLAQDIIGLVCNEFRDSVHRDEYHAYLSDKVTENPQEDLDELSLYHNPLICTAEMVADLIARGADVNAVLSPTAYSPLIWAAVRKNSILARLLLDAGAQADYRTIPATVGSMTISHGVTALHTAACLNDLEMVTLLLEKGANPDIVRTDGYSALSLTSELEIAQCLVKHNALLTVKNKRNQTALDVQIEQCNKEVDPVQKAKYQSIVDYLQSIMHEDQAAGDLQ